MIRLTASLLLFVIGNAAWADFSKLPVTDFSAGNQKYQGGVCTLDIRSFGDGFTFDIWIKPVDKFGASKHVEVYAESGPYDKTLPPEITKAPGFHTKEDVSYAGQTLTLRNVAIKWDGSNNDPNYFKYTRVVEIDITGGIDLGKISRVKYSFTNESANEPVWTETITCSVK